MNIKRAKQEIKDTIEAYLLKDRYGAYEIPAIRQRPVLLIGPPGVGKTQIMEQISQECQIGLVAYSSHQTKRHRTSLYPGKNLQRPSGVSDGIYHERDRGIYL